MNIIDELIEKLDNICNESRKKEHNNIDYYRDVYAMMNINISELKTFSGVVFAIYERREYNTTIIRKIIKDAVMFDVNLLIDTGYYEIFRVNNTDTLICVIDDFIFDACNCSEEVLQFADWKMLECHKQKSYMNNNKMDIKTDELNYFIRKLNSTNGITVICELNHNNLTVGTKSNNDYKTLISYNKHLYVIDYALNYDMYTANSRDNNHLHNALYKDFKNDTVKYDSSLINSVYVNHNKIFAIYNNKVYRITVDDLDSALEIIQDGQIKNRSDKYNRFKCNDNYVDIIGNLLVNIKKKEMYLYEPGCFWEKDRNEDETNNYIACTYTVYYGVVEEYVYAVYDMANEEMYSAVKESEDNKYLISEDGKKLYQKDLLHKYRYITKPEKAYKFKFNYEEIAYDNMINEIINEDERLNDTKI